MCAFCDRGYCELGGPLVDTLPVAFVLSEWRTHFGSDITQAVRPVGIVGPTLYLLETWHGRPLQPDERRMIAERILEEFDSPTWRERVTRIRWLPQRRAAA